MPAPAPSVLSSNAKTLIATSTVITTTPTTVDVPDSTTEPTTAPTLLLPNIPSALTSTPTPPAPATTSANDPASPSPKLSVPAASSLASNEPQNQQRTPVSSRWDYVGWTSMSTSSTIVQQKVEVGATSAEGSNANGEAHHPLDSAATAAETQDAKQKGDEAKPRLLEAVEQVRGPEAVVSGDLTTDAEQRR